MSPEALSELHHKCFSTPRPYSAAEFRSLLDSPSVALLTNPSGFLLYRLVVDEAELLTLAVDPDARRQGHGRALLDRFLDDTRSRGAVQVFLEVAADNQAAQTLYRAAGFRVSGLRKAYYSGSGGQKIDAITMVRGFETENTSPLT